MSVFTQLLTRLMGSRDPSALREERMAVWQSWCAPLGDAEVGRDPGHEDAFLAIKDEVGKVSGIDDAMIARACQQLLQETGKDVRVVGYYAFARLRAAGPPGFADGLELMAALVDRYGEQLLPARVEARKTALEWLASRRIIDLLHLHDAFQPSDLERAVSALDVIVTRTSSWPSEGRPDLQPLISRITVQEPAPVSAVAATAAGALSPAGGSTMSASKLSSNRDLQEQARLMAAWLRDQEHGYFPATRLVRCVRWDTLHEAPPADHRGRTRLMPPRAGLAQQLKRLVLQKQWHELLDRVEGAFTEGANHVWLDLQYFQHLALEQVGMPHEAMRETLQADVVRLLDRLPGMELLEFSDGTPFADDATSAWLDRACGATLPELIDPKLEARPLIADGSAAEWQETDARAYDLLENHGLDAAFAWLGDLPRVNTARQRFMQRWLMARLADQAGRPDIAQSLLDMMLADTHRQDLAEWEPGLIFDVKVQLQRVLKQALQRKSIDRASTLQRIDQLQSELTVLDPARVLAMRLAAHKE